MRLSAIFVFLLFCSLTLSKRGSGSRGRSRGFSLWTRKSKSDSKSVPKPVQPQTKPVQPVQPKPAKEPEIKKNAATNQQSAPNTANQKPIGWNVDQNNNQKQISQVGNNPYGNGAGHPQGYGQGAPPPYPGHSNPGAPPPYPGHTQGHAAYPGAPPAYPGYSQGHSGYPGAPPAYPGYSQGHSGYPGAPPPYPGHGYPQQSYGYHQPGYGGYPQQNTGLMGSMFGGKHGYGGFGNPYGYGMKKSGGFFGKHAFRNVLGGLFVWYLVSGLVRTPYKVYNFYNRPGDEVQDFTLPANTLALCNENATNICVPGTYALCTQDNRILCVAGASAVSPCQDNNGNMCVNSTIPCIDENDPLCQNKSTTNNETSISLPCFSNMTLEGTAASNVTLPQTENNTFCVTAMAVPDPSIPEEANPELEPVQHQNVTSIPSSTTGASTEGFNATTLQ